MRVRPVGFECDRPKFKPDRPVTVHCVSRVCTKVHDNLLKLGPIADSEYSVRLQTGLDNDGCRKRSAQKLDSVGNNWLNQYPPNLPLGATAEGENATDDRLGTPRRCRDLSH